MIQVNSHITLSPVNLVDQERLYNLMKRVYPSAYAHFWKDDCSWYLSQIYSKENLEQELSDANSMYYFVHYNDETVGILKLIKNCQYPPLASEKGFKIHRIYLDPSVQGKGVGNALMDYAQEVAIAQKHSLIWLDAMDKHAQAQQFYKKLGFQKTEKQRLDFPLLHDEHRPMWFMHKMLDSTE